MTGRRLIQARTTGRVLLLSWFWLISWSAAALELPDQTLRYSVDYRGTNAGELEIILSRTESGYLVKSISHLSLIATVFLQSLTIETSFDMVNGQPRLMSGKEILNKTGEAHRSYVVDYDVRRISFSDREPQQFDPVAWLDADAFPLALIFADLSSLAGKTFLSVSAKRARYHVYQKSVAESITVPAGTFNSNKIVNQRQDDPGRTITVWLRQGQNPVPVKIISGKQGKETTMVLIQ